MIIDSHAHIGEMLNFKLSETVLLDSMERYAIDFCLVSNVESSEVDHEQVLIPSCSQHSQLKSNERVLKFVKQHPNRLGALIWVKPLLEAVDASLEALIEENRAVIYGLKVHPYHSRVAFDDKRMIPYFELARKYQLPIVTHTANDQYSTPLHVYEVAKRYPDLNFVMVHLGLGTDHELAIKLISKLPNLYGDTTWVNAKDTLKAIKVCGVDKIMFGSDNPIDGLETLGKRIYQDYFYDLKNSLSHTDYEKLMGLNAKQIFKIKSF